MQQAANIEFREKCFTLKLVSAGEETAGFELSDSVENNRLTCSVSKMCSNNRGAEQVNPDTIEVSDGWSNSVENNRLTCSVSKMCSNNRWAEQVNSDTFEVSDGWDEEPFAADKASAGKGTSVVECLIPACWDDFEAIAAAQPNADDSDYQDWFAEFIEAYDALEAMIWLYAEGCDETRLGR